jgi:hypothetical protein
MSDYHGIIINLSQKTSEVLDALEIIGQKKLLFGFLVLHKVRVQPAEIEATIERLRKNMAMRFLGRQRFYCHFYRDDELIVVFDDRVFHVTTDSSTWKEILDHGQALGIARRQLNFAPCRFEDERF